MRRFALLALLVVLPAGLSAALVSFANGTVADAAAMNTNFAQVEPFAASWTNNSAADWIIGSQTGTQVALTNTVFEKGVTRTGNTWKHAATGVYMVQLQYRQNTGGDQWTQYAVTKDGASNAVGQSARTGSGDSATADTFVWSYVVDSTTATYQITGWAQGLNKTVRGATNMVGDPPWAGAARHSAVVNVWRVSP